MPTLVRVPDWGIDLCPRTEGREGREEQGRVRCTLPCQKVTQDIQVGLAPRPESSTPHALHAGPTETLPYAHSSTGYEPGVGSVTRPPQFRHQARRNCDSRKDSVSPLMRQRHARMQSGADAAAKRSHCRQSLACVAIATALARRPRRSIRPCTGMRKG